MQSAVHWNQPCGYAGHRGELCLLESDRQALSFQRSGGDLPYRCVDLPGQAVG